MSALADRARLGPEFELIAAADENAGEVPPGNVVRGHAVLRNERDGQPGEPRAPVLVAAQRRVGVGDNVRRGNP